MDLARLVDRLFGSERALRVWLTASLLANMGIVVTGAVVRVTSSGLGCPTWPRCSADAYVPHAELGIHGAIEFGNRLLTFVLIILAVGAFAAAWRVRGHGARVWWLTLIVGLGIPLQGVIGGITVLTRLNPWIVAAHLLVSVAIIVVSTWALATAVGPRPHVPSRGAARLARLTFAIAMVSVWLGTVVTGAGPHAGDAEVPRNGFDIEAVARVHSASAWVLIVSLVLTIVALRRAKASPGLRAAWFLAATVALQGVIGYLQYFNGLPVWLVTLHLVGVSVVTAAASWLWFAAGSYVTSGSIATAKNTIAR
ncbi:MAG: COX15/CtaA family protein [Arachnia sp.]